MILKSHIYEMYNVKILLNCHIKIKFQSMVQIINKL